MPSNSYIDYLELLIDVEKLGGTHFDYSKGTRGRKNLGYLTRSATVMLCAAWERYNENVLLECITRILETDIEASSLSKHIKEYISSKVKESKNNIYPIELADNGWKNLWKGYAINDTEALHTPNSSNLDKLFKRHFGIDEFSNTMWHKKSINKINEFIKVRGEIAHNGSKSKYVKFSLLSKTIELITENCIQIDYSLSQYLKEDYFFATTWEESYYRKLSSYKKANGFKAG